MQHPGHNTISVSPQSQRYACKPIGFLFPQMALNLDSPLTAHFCQAKRMNIDFLLIGKHHLLGEIVSSEIAHFYGSLASLFLVVEMLSTSSLGLARKLEKRTLSLVQQKNLG